MRTLSIDVGNHSIKVGLFDEAKIIDKGTFGSNEEVQHWVDGQEVGAAIVSNVGKPFQLKASFPLLEFGSDQIKLPIKNLYETPHTLGKDRLAVAIGANALFPHTSCLVVDLGTCITYDMLTQEAEYLGGAISPGLHMRFQAMHHFTARLPLVEVPTAPVELIGKDTIGCLQSGVVNGIKFEVEMAVAAYRSKYPNLKVLLCGGDAHFFESIIKDDIFAFPELVLHGLNHTLLYYNNAFL